MLWAVATTDGFMAVLAAFGIACALVSVLPLSLLTWVWPGFATLVSFAKPAALASLFALGLTLGHRIADEHAELMQAQFDRNWVQNELDVQRTVAAKAAQEAKAAAEHADEVDEAAESYVDSITKQPTPSVCVLGDDDVRGLRLIAPRSVEPKRSSPARLRLPRFRGSTSADQ